MNISAVNMYNQAFKATFHKGDKPTQALPTDIAPDVDDNENVYISRNSDEDYHYITAGQFRAEQAARKAYEEQLAAEEAAKKAQIAADAAKYVDNRPDDIKYWNY